MWLVPLCLLWGWSSVQCSSVSLFQGLVFSSCSCSSVDITAKAVYNVPVPGAGSDVVWSDLSSQRNGYNCPGGALRISFTAEQMPLVPKVKYVGKSHHKQGFGPCKTLYVRQR